MTLHIDAPVEEEGHAFALQQPALAAGITGADGRAQPAAPLHDALPWYARSVRIAVHRPAHDPRASRRPQQPSDLAVRRHLAPRNAPDQRVNVFKEAAAARPVEPCRLRSLHSRQHAFLQTGLRTARLVFDYLARTPAISTRAGSSGFCFPTTSANGVVTTSLLT